MLAVGSWAMGIKRSRGRTSNAASLFFVIFSCFSVVVHYSSSHAAAAAGGKDTITQGKEVGDSDFLVSAGGIFKLGFFNTSKYHYLGIWYNKGEPGRIAWVANRDTPIIDRSGALLIDGDGKLKITYGGGNSIVLNSDQTTTTKTTVNVTATLLDSGNFVLRGEEISNGSAAKQVVLWQSFDHPTDTLLPGMKLGFNLKTGRNWSLTSWVSGDVPAPGAFTLGGNPNGTSQLILRRRGDIYWTSGVWDSQILNFVPPINLNFDEMNFSYISNKDENYLTYSVNTNSFPNSMWTVGPNGKLVLYMSYDKIMTTIGHIMIDCSRNEKTDHWGCANERRLECRKGDEVFEQRTGYMRSDPYERDEDASLGLSDCDTKCWSNCSCIAYASSTDYGTGCQLWGGEISFEGNNSVQNEIYVLYSHSEVPYHPDVEPSTEVNPNASKKKLWVWFIIAVAATILMLLSGFLCYLRRGYFRPKGEKDMSQEKFLFELGTNVTPGELRETNEFQKEGKKDRELKLFSLASIMHATSNFSSTNKLGEGGFGPVYKGILPEGREIAVKRLSRSSGQGLVEFKNEIILIAKLQHMNLVRLLGCCLQEEEKILVYEYMPNRSLDSFVFDPTKRELLDWKKRFNIVEGITQGLLYLHKYSRLRVIHRDLKASNILLDDGMNPKISDFGMARIFGQNEIEANTNRVVGTYGYMSPEYAMDGIFSVKSDVYSYGVLLLEIMSGRRNTSFYNSDRVVNLTGYAWSLWKEGTTLELMDPMLGDSCPAHKLLRCIHIGLLCVQESPRDRPTMSDVASMLMNDTMPLPSPKQPAFFLGRNSIEIGLPKGNSENCSLNNMSISVIEAR